MSFNALLLQSIAVELTKLIGARVEKIHQPERSTITIELRLPGENLSLLLSTHPSLARFYLTEYKFINPPTPSSFCMLLRKHLEKYRLDSITPVPFERIVRLDFSREEDYGRSREKKSLILEIMGKHSNLILLDDSDHIIDAMYRIDETKSRVRQILPKLTYTLPPPQKKENPKNLNLEKFSWFLEVASPDKLPEALVKNIGGISPELARQIINSVDKPQNNPALVFTILKEIVNLAEEGLFVPSLNDGKLSFYPPTTGSVNKIVDLYYSSLYDNNLMLNKKNNLLSSLNGIIEKIAKKLHLRNEALENALLADEYRTKGDLLTASLYLIKKGSSQVEVPNYYEEGQPLVLIELDPRLTPNENAQSYYKRYNRARSALKNLDVLLEETEEELAYLKQTKGLVEAAKDLDDLESLHDELIKDGYLKPREVKQNYNKRKSDPASQPKRFLTPSGNEIVVGRNNRQNDSIRRQNSNDFWWFHTQKLPGAHVVLKSSNPSIEDLELAAHLAALFSKGSEDSLVLVDSARLMHVRKPPKAKPGFVVYDNEKTYSIKPDSSLLLRLKKLTE